MNYGITSSYSNENGKRTFIRSLGDIMFERKYFFLPFQ